MKKIADMAAATVAIALVLTEAASAFAPKATTTMRRGPFAKMFPEFVSSPFTFLDESPDNEPLFLSPLIKAGKIDEAREAARVHLEGPKIESYSGYLTVNTPDCGSNMFFWYFPAKYGSDSAPTLLWLQGGPGGTSLFGLFAENGPYVVTKEMQLTERVTSWALTHNVIYIDNPVGTGYSFTKKDSCYATDQYQVADDLYDALQQFFSLFPALRNNDFYVTGESYAGKYVPAISYKIYQMQKNVISPEQVIKFKGMAIGDGLCDPVTMTNYGDFLYGIGLIDEADREYFRNISKLMIQNIKSGNTKLAFQLFDDLLNGDLTGHPSYFANVTGYNYYFNYLMTNGPADMNYYNNYVQLANVRRAIHVGDMTWNNGSIVENHLLEDVMKSNVKPWIEEILEQGYKVMIYNGLMDVIVAWPLTENFLASLTNWSGTNTYLKAQRVKWMMGGSLAGYAKQVDNFTQVVVRNAGHMVPYDQPKAAFDMINRFILGKKFG